MGLWGILPINIFFIPLPFRESALNYRCDIFIIVDILGLRL